MNHINDYTYFTGPDNQYKLGSTVLLKWEKTVAGSKLDYSEERD